MPTRLRRVDCSARGIRRRRRGRGFGYVDEAGVRIDDPDVLRRIAELAIPPAWQDVWICPYPNGHLQATGTDAAGRKQSRYHDAWRTRRDGEKFDDMVRFAEALPALRRRVELDLRECTTGLTIGPGARTRRGRGRARGPPHSPAGARARRA
jgi:DNA topoisomerase-1